MKPANTTVPRRLGVEMFPCDSRNAGDTRIWERAPTDLAPAPCSLAAGARASKLSSRGRVPPRKRARLPMVAALVSLSFVLARMAGAGLVINPVFDPSITGASNAATIINTINSAIQVYESQFSDPVTVSIRFANMNSGLGQSLTYITSISYTSFYSALTNDARTTNAGKPMTPDRNLGSH